MANIVKKYYDTEGLSMLSPNKKFHYLSRMYLWTGEKKYRHQLDIMKQFFLQNSEGESIESEKDVLHKEPKGFMVSLRAPYFLLYPELKKYTSVLFRYRYAHQLYAIDLSGEVLRNTFTDSYIALADRLLSDKKAMCILGTHAINYLYALAYYLQQSDSRRIIQNMQKKIFQISHHYRRLPKSYAILEIYYMTHTIIGVTNFYGRSLTKKEKKQYLSMVVKIESLIEKQYFMTKLDIKCEFLVCCAIVEYTSKLSRIIENEVSLSVGENGYIIDTYNSYNKTSPTSLDGSEHRNVLWIMSQTKLKNK